MVTITRAGGNARTVPPALRIDTAIKVECLRRGDTLSYTLRAILAFA